MIDKTKSFAKFRPSYDVDDAATFFAGQLLMLGTDAAGNKVAQVCDAATAPLGIAYGDKATTLYQLVMYEAITFTGAASVISLAHSNLLTGTVAVEDTAHTTVYTGGGVDYTVSLVNGTITHVAIGAIGALATVHVTYKFEVPASQMNFWGQSYERNRDDTIGSGKVTAAKGTGTIFTDMFDQSLGTYALNAALRCTAAGLWTTAGAGPVAGKVAGLPTASNPYMEIDFSIPNA